MKSSVSAPWRLPHQRYYVHDPLLSQLLRRLSTASSMISAHGTAVVACTVDGGPSVHMWSSPTKLRQSAQADAALDET
jgi:hypothetical protein